MTRYICVTSGKGGVGKTTTAINLASALQKQGNDVILVEGNISTPNIHLHLGAEAEQCLHDAIYEKTHPARLVYRHDSGLRIVPANTRMEHLKYPHHEGFKDAIMDLDGHAEIIIVDGAPGFGREAVVPMEVTNEIMIVTTPDHLAIEDARRTVEVARELRKPVLGAVVNMVRGDRLEHTIDEVAEHLGIPVIAVIPHDDKIRSSLVKKHPVVHIHPKSKSSKGFRELAALVIGPKYAENLEDKAEKYAWNA